MKKILKRFIQLVFLLLVFTNFLWSQPYFENFESGDGNYTELGSSDFLWAHGTPSGPGPNVAFSGANCWGTRLSGNYGVDNVDDYLVSPSINLTLVSTATLTFWHYYDTEPGFDYDEGVVQISIDNGNSFINISPAFRGYSFGWINERIDISPYTGNNILIRFWFSTDFMIAWYPGWYIDDISIIPSITYPLPTPQWISATPIAPDKAELVWSNVADATNYILYRNTTGQPIFSSNVTSYTDSGLEKEKTYYYWIKAFNSTNYSLYSKATNVRILISLPIWAVFPTKFNPNDPNNEDGVAKIFFGGGKPEVEVKIYDVFGNPVRFWSLSEIKGKRLVEWDGKDDEGNDVNAGIYIVYIKGSDISPKTIRMMLVK